MGFVLLGFGVGIRGLLLLLLPFPLCFHFVLGHWNRFDEVLNGGGCGLRGNSRRMGGGGGGLGGSRAADRWEPSVAR